MGCFSSKQIAGNDGTANGELASVPANAQNASTQQQQTTPQQQRDGQQQPASSSSRRPSAGNTSTEGSSRHHRSKPGKLKTRINKPLKRHVWAAPASQQPRPTVDGMRRQRNEFFETRVTGKPEVWNALNTAIDAMREPGSEALAFAQEVLNAADVTLPQGDLIGGAYDMFGNFYEFPEYALSDPINVLNFSDQNGSLDESMTKEKGKAVAIANEVNNTNTDVQKNTEATSPQEMLKIRLSNGKDLQLRFSTNETVISIKDKVMEAGGLNTDTHELRFVQMGKILDDHRSLYSQGWRKDFMLLGLIVNSSGPKIERTLEPPPVFANERSASAEDLQMS